MVVGITRKRIFAPGGLLLQQATTKTNLVSLLTLLTLCDSMFVTSKLVPPGPNIRWAQPFQRGSTLLKFTTDSAIVMRASEVPTTTSPPATITTTATPTIITSTTTAAAAITTSSPASTTEQTSPLLSTIMSASSPTTGTTTTTTTTTIASASTITVTSNRQVSNNALSIPGSNITFASPQTNESFNKELIAKLSTNLNNSSLKTHTSTVPTLTPLASNNSNQPINQISINQNFSGSSFDITINGSSSNSNGSLVSFVHPLLIYSIRHEIRSYDLFNLSSRSSSNGGNFAPPNAVTSNSYSLPLTLFDQHASKHSKTLISGLKNTIGLDFYYSESESYIFWTDVIEERIYKGTIINGTITNVEMVVQTALATAEGLAVDWVGRNIYWVESTLDHIEVANMNGSCRRTLIAGEMESPRAIAVDPRLGLLFWTDWDKKQPRIERATMSGEDRRTIVQIKEVNGGWPNGLTLDYESKKIYWIDANSDSIHFVDYDGSKPQPLLKHIKSLGHPFSITLFENHLYWTDWKTNSVSTANKFDGSEVRELQRLTSRPFDIKVFHPSRQPTVDNQFNPCFKNNGNCSHFCLLSGVNTRKCECPHLKKLAQDGVTCKDDDRVLLIGRINEIRAVDIDDPLYHIMAPISIPKVFHPRQFEFDAKTKTIFWADVQTNEVERAQLAGTSIDTIIDVIIESPNGLALDWISGNIYVTSLSQQKTGKIYISNLNGEYISVLMDASQGIVSPKSIAVHPKLGLLFCIDENENSEPIIFVASMDGKRKRTIASRLNDPKLENPSSLSIDYELNRVYWINQALLHSDNASIQYYDILRDRIVTILDESESQPSAKINPSILCIDGDYLLIVSPQTDLQANLQVDVIMKIHKDNLSDRTILKTQTLSGLSALRVYNASAQTGSNACSQGNGGCSQLCIPTNSTHRACKCTMGYSINPFNETECTGRDLFLIFSNNLGMKGISLEPNSSPDDNFLPPIHKAFRASSIDFVHKDNLIYWVDNEEGSIMKTNRDTTSYQVIVSNLESEGSIGIDWVAGNIYWLDPYYDIIEVARLNGSNRYVIVSGDMDKANGIVVNPITGYIVWSDIGSFPKIETARLDGSERRVIVNTNLSHIDDLAVDYIENYIYWVDSTLGIIERVKEDGTGRQLVYSSNLNLSSQSHLVSLAVYQDYLFIADSSQNQGSIIRCDKNDALNRRLIQQHLGDGIRDIAVFTEQPLPTPEDNPCVQNNGGCQDLCLFLGARGKKRCICSHGKLDSDSLTCKPYDTFVLFSKLSQIDSLHIKEEESFNNSPYPPISIENKSSIISLTVDYRAQRVIYSEISRDQICSILFNGTDRRVLVEKQSFVEGIAFANDQLYWTSIHDNSISRLNTTSLGIPTKTCNAAGCKTATTEKIITLTADDKPRGIAVDICTSYIYWTNWNTNASIQRATSHTGYKIESIINTNIKVPNGIAIDHKLRKLYWCDARLDKIETCDMDGSNRIVLSLASPQHPFALAIWENYVFWTDWLARGVFKADKYTGQQPVQIKKVSQRPMGIAVAAPEILECPNDPCVNNGGCPPGHRCTVFLTSPSGERAIECAPSHQRPLQHVSSMWRSNCKNTRDKSDPKACDYHDVIMSTLDGLNMTDLEPIESKSPSTLSSISSEPSTDHPFSANRYAPGVRVLPNDVTTIGQQAIMVLGNVTGPPKALESADPVQVNFSSGNIQAQDMKEINSDKTTLVYHDPTPVISSNTPIPSALTSTSGPPFTTPTPNAALTAEMTTPGSQFAATMTTNASEPGGSTPTPTQAPLTNSTLPPCQIVPAALQPTTDASSINECKGQFKCYLSDKLICIPADRRCDSNYDCPGKEDESDCLSSPKSGSYNLKRESNWHRFATGILIILGATVAALFLVFGSRGRRRWFVGTNGAFNHRRMFDDSGTNIEISNPMFDEDDSGNLVHCAFSIDLNERTTNFSNPLYERQVLLMNEKHVTSN